MNRRKSRLRIFGVYKPVQEKPKKFFTLEGKTIWDVSQLLIIPLVLAIIAIYFNWSENRRNESTEANRIIEQRAIEADRANAEVLRTYLSSMTELLLEKNLRSSPEDSEVRYVARATTISALNALDNGRRELLVEFLIEAGLIQSNKVSEDNRTPIISLSGAELPNIDLTAANLKGADLVRSNLAGTKLSWANLGGANLTSANLNGAVLSGTDLKDANIQFADLRNSTMYSTDLTDSNLLFVKLDNAQMDNADLSGAILTLASLAGADLTGATVTDEQLSQAWTLKGATMPDGKIYDPAIHAELSNLRRDAGRDN